MKVLLLTRSGREIKAGGFDLRDDALVEDLQKAIYAFNPKWHPCRQRLTVSQENTVAELSSVKSSSPSSSSAAIIMASGKRLSDFLPDSKSCLTVNFKDLGPQIGYRTVFFWEYFGPLIIYPLPYFFPTLFYGQSFSHCLPQRVALAYWSFHYAKRIFETYFIHSFSHGTMPLFNLFRNCTYYWASSLFVSFFLNHPLYTPVSEKQFVVGIAIALFGQWVNFKCHVILRNLRSDAQSNAKGSPASPYFIPRGFLFDYITCANYTGEVLGWLGFNIFSQTLAGFLFLCAGVYQMAMWAVAKHRRLKKLYDGKEGRPKYPRRWIMLPPFF